MTAPTTAVFAAAGMFGPAEQAEFIAARPGTRHVVLAGGSHDAHLDATAEWAAALSRALEGRAPPLACRLSRKNPEMIESCCSGAGWMGGTAGVR